MIWDDKERWYARYRSKRVFGHFQLFTISVRPSDTMYDLDTIVGCVLTPWEFTRRHSDHFQPCTIHINPFPCLLPYIWLIATSMDYLCLPHTIVYLFDVFPTLSDLLRPFVDFIYLRSYQHSDVLIIYSYGWLRYYYRFGLWSLRTISHIQFLRRHFNLSEVIFTYILPTAPITYRE
jgi:hypothetical protein